MTKITNVIPRIPMKSTYQQIFFCHCYSCNNFGHKSLKSRSYGKVHDYTKDGSSNKPKERNHNHFQTFNGYDIECYKCNNFGHMAREYKLRKSVSVED